MNPSNRAASREEEQREKPPSHDEATGRSMLHHTQDYPPCPQIPVDDHSPSAPPISSWGANFTGSPSSATLHPHNHQVDFKTLGHPDKSSSEQIRVVAGPEGAGVEQKADTVTGSEDSASAQRTGVGMQASEQGANEGHTAPVPEGTAAGKKPLDNIFKNLNMWGKKAKDVTGNVWSHLKTGPSMTDTARGRLTQGAKVLKEGGFEKVFKQLFDTMPNEQLKKSYACYLSTSTGPIVGTLYISTAKFAFCSDRPLQNNPSDQQASTYYKVAIPLERVKAVMPSANKDKPAEKYIQTVSVDDQEFWFMGFVNYNKGLKNMQEAIYPPLPCA
ncbi:hypothetical protein O6H91_02G018000 [Diphasiastrum complanatum]|uniref:Uncharacterized protein n=2 Tax=Diphasiastrum complanatum TaxID=34168 RepID=A0ACC2ED92_DIPCM|nr:hypothetical protein O6H91_02G018000 [Diphasiastrum complanatum]